MLDTKSTNQVYFTIVPALTILRQRTQLYIDKPPYRVRLEKNDYRGCYDIHIDLNCADSCVSSGLLWFNYTIKNGRLEPHWQFKNKSDCPQDFLNIPMIKDIISNTDYVFEHIRQKE